MTIVTQTLMGTHVTVSETERTLVTKNGCFETILTAGSHTLMRFTGR